MKSSKSRLKFLDVDVHFNYVFDIGYPLNPIDAARRILKTDLGQAFRNYLSDKSEIADRYKPLSEEYKKITNLEDTELEAEKLLKESKEQADQTIIELLGLLSLHEDVDRQIFFSGYLKSAPFVRISLQPFGATILGRSILFDVTLTIHRTGIAILTAYGGFSGSLLLEDILKLERFDVLPLQDCEIPTVAIKRYTNLSTGYIPGIVQQEYASDDRGSTKFEGDEASDFGRIFDAYRCFCTETILAKKHWSLGELEQSLRSNHWHGYPIVFIKKTEPTYPSGTEFKKSRAETLAKLVLGIRGSMSLKPKVVSDTCAEDLSITDDYSVYLTEGSGTVIYYKNHKLKVSSDAIVPEWTRQKFLTSVVVDMLLLQRAILFTFNNQLNRATYDIAKLTGLKQEYILALQEFEALGLSHYGTVHNIIKHGHESFRINDLRRLFITKLEGIEGLIQRAKEKQAKNREGLVKILTTFVAVTFSLSASQNVIDVIRSWSPNLSTSYPHWVAVLYEWILAIPTQHPVFATIILSLVTVIITLLALSYETLLAPWYEKIKDRVQRRLVIENRNIPKSSELTILPVRVATKDYKDTNEKTNKTNQ